MINIDIISMINNATFSDWIVFIQTFLAVGGFIFAYQEFKQWRVELLGSKKIELGLQIAQISNQIQSAFEDIRRPRSTRDADMSDLLENIFELSEVLQTKLRFIRDLINHLYSLNLKTEILFGKSWSDRLNENIQAYSQHLSHLNTVYYLLFHLSDLTLKNAPEKISEARDILFPYISEDQDEFAKNIQKIAENIYNIIIKNMK